MIKWRYGKQNVNKDDYRTKLYIRELTNEQLDIMEYLKSWRYSPDACKRRIEKLEFGEKPND